MIWRIWYREEESSEVSGVGKVKSRQEARQLTIQMRCKSLGNFGRLKHRDGGCWVISTYEHDYQTSLVVCNAHAISFRHAAVQRARYCHTIEMQMNSAHVHVDVSRVIKLFFF